MPEATTDEIMFAFQSVKYGKAPEQTFRKMHKVNFTMDLCYWSKLYGKKACLDLSIGIIIYNWDDNTIALSYYNWTYKIIFKITYKWRQ